MSQMMEKIGQFVATADFDQVAAGALLGVIATGIVAFGNTLVTYWGLRHNLALAKAEKGGLAGVSGLRWADAGGDVEIAFSLGNVGATPVVDANVRLRSDGSTIESHIGAIAVGGLIPVKLTARGAAGNFELDVAWRDVFGRGTVRRYGLDCLPGGDVGCRRLSGGGWFARLTRR